MKIHQQKGEIARDIGAAQEPSHTIKMGSGTCRDFAWLMVEALRRLGYAARFVTGYLYEPGDAAGDQLDWLTDGDFADSGVAMNVIADRCSIGLDIRYAPALGEKGARRRIEQALKERYAREPVGAAR